MINNFKYINIINTLFVIKYKLFYFSSINDEALY